MLAILATALACVALLLSASSASAKSFTVISFDGTPIHVNFFAAAGLKPGHRAPTVLVGPGWGSPGDTNPNGPPGPSTGYPGLGALRHAGFNVVTWDPRGFGASGGTVEIDSPSFEGRDVSAIITWLAHQPQALLDGPGDPRVGMAGGSYGGGIQLVSAAIDPRIDAIVPDISWHSLVTSLYKSQTVKSGWAGLLYLAAAGDRLNPIIRASWAAGQAGGPLTPQEVDFYATRGPGALVRHIHIPTLLVQGTVDTLFTLQEAVDNYRILRADGVPVHMLWFCGGHGICLTNPGDTALIVRYTVAWLKRYLMRDPHIHTGPGFEWVDQDGGEHSAPSYPLPSGTPILAHGSGKLTVTDIGGAGPLKAPPGVTGLGEFVAPITPTRAANAVNLRLPAPRHSVLVIGAPQLTITYHGHAVGHGAPVVHLYAQLIDDATGKVLGNQITPFLVRLNGSRHTVTVPLEIVAALDRRGEHFTLQITASTVAYQTQLARGGVTFSRITVALPTALR